jgi:hypothetical protein
MKRISLSALLLALLALATACATSQNEATAQQTIAPVTTGANDPNAAQEIAQLERDWSAAMSKGDYDTLEKMIADDAVLERANSFSNKTEYLSDKRRDVAKEKSDGVKTTETVDEVKVKPYGEVYLSYGRYTSVTAKAGKTETSRSLFLDVVAKRNGRWQFVAMTTSSITPEAPSPKTAAATTKK